MYTLVSYTIFTPCQGQRCRSPAPKVFSEIQKSQCLCKNTLL